jgi:hypothetical protein
MFGEGWGNVDEWFRNIFSKHMMDRFPVVWHTAKRSWVFPVVSKNSDAFMGKDSRSAKPSLWSSEPLKTATRCHFSRRPDVWSTPLRNLQISYATLLLHTTRNASFRKYRAFGKSLCTYKRFWKWRTRASLQAWTLLILFVNCISTAV